MRRIVGLRTWQCALALPPSTFRWWQLWWTPLASSTIRMRQWISIRSEFIFLHLFLFWWSESALLRCWASNGEISVAFPFLFFTLRWGCLVSSLMIHSFHRPCRFRWIRRWRWRLPVSGQMRRHHRRQLPTLARTSGTRPAVRDRPRCRPWRQQTSTNSIRRWRNRWEEWWVAFGIIP